MTLNHPLPDDPLKFIQRCIGQRKILWTYHVNIRLKGRFIPRQALIESYASYEIIEQYLKDKYLPSYLLTPELGRVGGWLQNQEAAFMKCHVCGSKLKPLITDLPFNFSDETIVILKSLPVLQCENCSEYLLDDPVMARVERILEKVNVAAELEIIRYAA